MPRYSDRDKDSVFYNMKCDLENYIDIFMRRCPDPDDALFEVLDLSNDVLQTTIFYIMEKRNA